MFDGLADSGDLSTVNGLHAVVSYGDVEVWVINADTRSTRAIW